MQRIIVSALQPGDSAKLFVPVSALQELRTAKQQMRVCHERCVNAAPVGGKKKERKSININKNEA